MTLTNVNRASNIPVLINYADMSADPAAAKYLKTATVLVEFADQDGAIDTMEGRVPYLAGDAILTGVIGEKWPVKRRVFDSLYEPVADTEQSEYRKKQGATVFAKQMDFAFRTKIRDGSATLEGKQGDWLVQYAVGDVGVVANEIFCKSYRALDSRHL